MPENPVEIRSPCVIWIFLFLVKNSSRLSQIQVTLECFWLRHCKPFHLLLQNTQRKLLLRDQGFNWFTVSCVVPFAVEFLELSPFVIFACHSNPVEHARSRDVVRVIPLTAGLPRPAYGGNSRVLLTSRHCSFTVLPQWQSARRAK